MSNQSYCTLYANKDTCKDSNCTNCAYKVEVKPIETIFNFAEISRKLTGSRSSIRQNYDGKKYIEAVEELRDFESEWMARYIQKLI